MTHPLETENRRLREAAQQARAFLFATGYAEPVLAALDAALATEPASGGSYRSEDEADMFGPKWKAAPPPPPTQDKAVLLKLEAYLRQHADEAARAAFGECERIIEAEQADWRGSSGALERITAAIRAHIAPKGEP